MKGHLPPPVKRERLSRLLDVARRSSEGFLRSQEGRVAPVLWEQRVGGLWQGLTHNYARVYATEDSDLENKLLTTRLAGLHGDGLLGMLEAVPV
jgi:tRNA A37 methylthiotransferase MiaB